MKILVTGGAGFLGAATVAAGQAAGHDMEPYDRAHGGDILDRANLRASVMEVDHVIHLAGVLGTAELFDDPHLAVDVNIHGALNVLEACVEAGAGYTAISMPPVFKSVYTATKVCADRLATAWHHSMGLGTSHVIAYNAFGAGQKHGPGHPQKIIPTFATWGWRNEPIEIWGDGEQTVDLIHADDLGRMLVDATDFHDDEVFDGGTGYALTVNQVADYVIERTGSTAGIRYLPMRKGETATEIAAEGRGWGLLDWAPRLDWDVLGATIDAYRPAGA